MRGAPKQPEANANEHIGRPEQDGAAIIDPVLDYDFKAGRTDTKAADRLLAYVQQQGLSVEWILETHAHADHLSAARYLHQRVGGKVAIGENIREVQATACPFATSCRRTCTRTS